MRVVNGRRLWVRLLPQALCDGERLDAEALPPIGFIPGLMLLPVMAAAERHCEFIADLHPQRSGLRKAKVMRVRRLTSADKTGLRGNKLQVGLVAQPFGFGDGKLAFIDLAGEQIGRCQWW